MNVDDVLALVKAGFTADQIQAMNTQQEQQLRILSRIRQKHRSQRIRLPLMTAIVRPPNLPNPQPGRPWMTCYRPSMAWHRPRRHWLKCFRRKTEQTHSSRVNPGKPVMTSWLL